MKHVFIIGSKGIPANYGGFETFVEHLTKGSKKDTIQYYVACMDDHEEEVSYNGTKCFHIKVPPIGPAKAIYYDVKAFLWCLHYMKKNKIKNGIIYVLACRIGPMAGWLGRKLKSYGGLFYVNPDGHEWKRAKWNYWIRKYWKFSEKLMVKHADLLICDSKNIESYIQKEYKKYAPETTYIAYGAEEDSKKKFEENKLFQWYQKHHIRENEYYLVVGRFVPENNYETMLREFMKAKTTKDFVLITNVENNKFYQKLKEQTGFDKDKRIKFVGTVYEEELLQQIRKHAYAYLHGHEVGGTNPSLLEALGSTEMNLLLDVGFNSEVAEDGALYWNKTPESLKTLIEEVDTFSEEKRKTFGKKAKARIREAYSWEFIVEEYEKLFENSVSEEKPRLKV